MCAMLAPQRVRPFELKTTRMAAHELGDNVFALMPAGEEDHDHTATTGGFVIGSRCVLMIESLSTGRLASEAIAAVRARTMLPIRYLVNTSFHSDHWFGNFVFPAETVVIAHPRTKHVLEEQFENERDNMEAFLGYRPGSHEAVSRPVDVTVPDEIAVDLGGVDVSVRYIGYIQTEGDLAVKVPSANVVFVGNALPGPPPAFHWVFDGRIDETIASTKRFCASLDDETTIVPGHGKPIRRSDVDYSLGYLRKLQALVGECVAAGFDLPATLERARMDEYSNYSCYELAHFRVNVPGAFADAAKKRAGGGSEQL
jgi:glyoxylase-like metal-dependent hydrolase (beta-lactamase superfamily II)